MLSVLFLFIVNFKTKFGNKLLIFQILSYVVLSLFALLLIVIQFGVDVLDINILSQLFWVLFVVSVGLLIVLWIVSAKSNEIQVAQKTNSEYVTITKQEYAHLLQEIKDLKQKLQDIKQ